MRTRVSISAWVLLMGLAGVARAAEPVVVFLTEEELGKNPAGTYASYEGDVSLDGHNFFVSILAVKPSQERAGVRLVGVYFTANKDEGYRDRQYFPNVLGVGGQLYDVSCDTEHKTLTLTPYAGKTAPVTVPIETERLSLVSTDEATRVYLYRPGTKPSIPLGSYRLQEYQLARNDAGGALWCLWAEGTDQTPVLTVAEEVAASLAVGGPYIGRIEAPEKAEKSVPLTFYVEGVGKERGTVPLPFKTSVSRAAPSYVIKDAGGNVVAEGQFRYG